MIFFAMVNGEFWEHGEWRNVEYVKVQIQVHALYLSFCQINIFKCRCTPNNIMFAWISQGHLQLIYLIKIHFTNRTFIDVKPGVISYQVRPGLTSTEVRLVKVNFNPIIVNDLWEQKKFTQTWANAPLFMLLLIIIRQNRSLTLCTIQIL